MMNIFIRGCIYRRNAGRILIAIVSAMLLLFWVRFSTVKAPNGILTSKGTEKVLLC